MLTQAAALAAVSQHRAQHQPLTAAAVAQALGRASVTFAQLVSVTRVQTAAKHRAEDLCKVTDANVMLCANLRVHTDIYARQVRRTAGAFAQNDAQAIADFEAQQNYFEHTDCYSIVAHRQHAHKLYLYAIYRRSRVQYVHNGACVSKEHVAQYMTPSAAQELLQPKPYVHNVTHNIIHSVRVRTPALDSIVQLRVRRQLLHI